MYSFDDMNESAFDPAAETLREEKGPFNDMYGLFATVGAMIKGHNAKMMTVEVDGESCTLGETHDENGTYVFELRQVPTPPHVEMEFVLRVAIQETGAKEPEEWKGRKFRFRLNGRELTLDSISVEKTAAEPEPIVLFRLSDTGTKAAPEPDLGKRPSTAAGFKSAVEKTGRNPKGMPGVWVVYDHGVAERPTVPNFAVRKGNFVHVNLVTFDEFAADEGHDVADTLRILSKVPQDLELVFKYGGKAYEIDSVKIIPAEGLRVEMRDWGEIDESSNAYSGTIRQWRKYLAEAETHGVWSTDDNGDIFRQAKDFENLF